MKTKGHWPKGKSRNLKSQNFEDIRRVIRKIKGKFSAISHPHDPTQVVSCKGISREIGVSDRSVRRWLSGEHVPGEEHVKLLKKWLQQH